MSEYLKDPDTWISLAAIIISVIALFINVRQISFSNKQHLFDRRLEKYLLFKDLLGLYKDNRNLLLNNKDICEFVDFDFALFTNCSWLETITNAIDNPLGKMHKLYLTKMEMLKKYATEIELLWDTEAGKLAATFTKQYKDLLTTMYKQKIIIESARKVQLSTDDFIKRTREKAEEIGLFKIIDEIDRTFCKITEKNVEQNIVKSIRL